MFKIKTSTASLFHYIIHYFMPSWVWGKDLNEVPWCSLTGLCHRPNIWLPNQLLLNEERLFCSHKDRQKCYSARGFSATTPHVIVETFSTVLASARCNWASFPRAPWLFIHVKTERRLLDKCFLFLFFFFKSQELFGFYKCIYLQFLWWKKPQ